MEDFTTFEIAKKLKEKGFPQHIAEDAYIIDNYGEDEYQIGDRLPIPLIPDYMDDIAAPTISQVLKWLLDKKKIFLTVDIESRGFFYIVNYDILTNLEEEHEFQIFTPNGCYRTPQEAYESGIEHILDNMV